jgi:Tfp pilus assembly protein PilX
MTGTERSIQKRRRCRQGSVTGRSGGDARRGVSILTVVALLLVLNLMIVGLVTGTGRDHDLTSRRMETVRAFYAMEAGVNMAMRELMESSDEDGDGMAGTISDDTDDGTDPSLSGGARVVVTLSTSGAETTLSSEGRAGEARRHAEAVLE